jgi:ABC-2 type transport system ATP-binding protein
VDALAGLDLSVPAHRITVLLGPNGAGKTTAIRMITGALDPHAGTVRTFGLDPSAHGEDVRRRCGVVSAKPALYDRLDGHANLAYAAELYGLGRGDGIDERIRGAAARFGIEHALGNRVGGYSTGMKTRLALARSILHEPDLLLFDEPTSGLDPESSHAVLEMIREMTDDGRTVVMCTHLLLEAEGLADKVIVMEDGKDLVSGTPTELTRRFWPGTVLLVGAENPELLTSAATIPGVRSLEADTDPTRVRLHLDGDHRVPDVILALVANGIRLTRAEPLQPSLEDLYFAVRTKKEVAADGGRQLTPAAAEGPVTDRHRQVAALTGWPGSEGSS